MANVDSLIGQVMVDDGVRVVTVLDGRIQDVEPDGFITVNLLISSHNGTTNRDVAGHVQTNMTGSYYRDVSDGVLHQRMQYKVNQWVWELAQDEGCNEVWDDVDVSDAAA